MYKIFGDIAYCKNKRDDIIIGGKSEHEHEEVLQKVLQRARQYNVKFTRDKCEFNKRQIACFGHVFTGKGLKADETKVVAITECSKPESKEKGRSFPGMTGYLDTFIPNYAVITAPLRKLTEKKIPFQWGKEQESSFKKLKDAVSKVTTISYFDPHKQTILRTEASFNEGIAAGLFQMSKDGIKPVHFISRALSEVKRKYSQTEKDALAITWATQ